MAFNPLTLRSYRLQNIQLEFASLKHVQLQGIYLSLTPGDPTLWTGVLFVRKGPYTPAVFRFSVYFPPTYPTSLPIVTFTADIFHPLLAPLTTYTYTGTTEADSITASREERLPPGAFSLRHEFQDKLKDCSNSAASGLGSATSDEDQTDVPTTDSEHLGTVDILRFIRSSFEDESVLDALPFDAAANPSAWYAWKSYREDLTAIQQQRPSDQSDKAAEPHQTPEAATVNSASARPRHPSQWKWDGVWKERVKRAISASLSEPVLYGASSRDETHIQFVNSTPEETEAIHHDMRKSLAISN